LLIDDTYLKFFFIYGAVLDDQTLTFIDKEYFNTVCHGGIIDPQGQSLSDHKPQKG
jgi:hypothetical protein